MCKHVDPESCTRCYAFWCILFGLISMVLHVVFFGIFYRRQPEYFCYYHVILLVILVSGILFSISCVFGGVLLLLGISTNSPLLFDTGKVLSYAAPIGYFYLIFPIVLHVMAVPQISDYKNDRWYD